MAVKDINLQKSEKMPVQSLFFEFKICIPQDAMCCENFGKFHRRKFKQIANTAIKKVKNTFVWAFIIQD